MAAAAQAIPPNNQSLPNAAPISSGGGVTMDDAGEQDLETTSNPSPTPKDLDRMPETIHEQADQTKYYAPTDDSNPDTATAKKAGALAYQDQNDPSVVAVLKADPKGDNAAVQGHEAYHALVANMPPTESAKIPDDTAENRYDYTDAPKWRAAGKTITDIPQEKAARMVEDYIRSNGTRQDLKPWIGDLKNIKQSTILPTRPGQVDINTEARAPKGGQEMLKELQESDVHNPPPKAAAKPVDSARRARYNGASALSGR